MNPIDKTRLIILVQNSYRVFCYFNISNSKIEIFEEEYGINSWKKSKAVIKVYSVEEGQAREIKTILLENNEDNLYIDIYRENLKIFLKLGRLLNSGIFVPIIVSNTVITPRSRGVSKEMKSISSEFI